MAKNGKCPVNMIVLNVNPDKSLGKYCDRKKGICECLPGFDSSDGSELGTGGSQYILCVPEMLDETADSNGPETGEEV